MDSLTDTIDQYLRADPFSSNGTTDHSIEDLLELAKVDLSEEIKASPTCISFLQKGKELLVGTFDNFMAVIGKAKSRKTFFIIMLIAAALRKELFGFIKVSFPVGKDKILYFDTEQSRYHVQRSIKRIFDLAGGSGASRLSAYGLRKYAPQQRLEMIEHALYNTKGVGLVVIDGIRDLLSSINDEEQATAITTKLLKWTEELNIHMIIVLHQNKGDNNARGHIGTEIINKAETVISITKEPDNENRSIVKADYTRDRDFQPFAFEIDENGLPILSIDQFMLPSGVQGNKPGKKSFTHADVAEDTHIKVLTEIFAFTKNPTYKDLVSQLRVYFNKRGVEIGDNKAKDFITHYQNEAWITKEKQSKKYPFYQLSTSLSESEEPPI